MQPGSIVPDQKRFGVIWMNERDLAAALDMTGAFNNLSLKLAYGNNPGQVLAELDRLLKPYGSVGGFRRGEQVSHQYLSDELKQLRGMAVMAPAIFLSVAAFLLNIVVSRMISQQREQIAALKAFGYSKIEVGLHYLNFVLIISLLGTMAVTALGFWMATGVTEMYQKFYKFPVLEFRIDWLAIGSVFLITTLAALIGTWVSVREAIRMPPAEAMRPLAPSSYRRTLLERMLPAELLSAELRMVIRNVARRPFKSWLSILGIGMAVAVMIIGSFSLDAVNYMMDFQFRKAQRQDLTVTFTEPATESVMHELKSLNGVLSSETMRSVAARIHFQNRWRRVGIMGIEPHPQLFRLLDTNERAVPVPEHGIMLNTKLAELLGAHLGDLLTVEVLEGLRPTLTIEVTAITEEYAGVNAYMNKQQLHAHLKESNVSSGAFLRADSNMIEPLFLDLESRPGVASVAIKSAVIDSFDATVAENILVMRSFIIMFATVIAIGVVYNSARIALSERSRDLATMRVMGFSQSEVSMVLLGEIALFTIAAIPLGWLIGYVLAAYMVSGLDTENYRIPLVISWNTILMASLVVIVATVLSSLIVLRRVKHLDLVGVLKTRE